MTNNYDYDCAHCTDKKCEICPVEKTIVPDPIDDYRKSVKRGYHTSSIIERRDKNGKSLGYAYIRPDD